MRKSSPCSRWLTGSCLALALLFGSSCSVLVSTPTLAKDAKRDTVVQCNNDGVNHLKKEEFDKAAAKFIEALTLAPSYSLARSNLGIAYNNWGLSVVKKDPRLALKYFHLAVWFSSEKEKGISSQNLEFARTEIYKNTKSFDALVTIARDCAKRGDHAGAIWEYKQALKLKEDDVVRAELEKVQLPEDLKRILAPPRPADVDFGPYMAALQKKIKRHWFPPKRNASKHVVAIFQINRAGQLKKLRLSNSDGAKADKAALAAVKDAAPFDRLPEGAPEVVDIQFTFDYNIFDSSDKNKVATKDGATKENGEQKANPRDSEPKVSEGGDGNVGSSSSSEISEAVGPVREANGPSGTASPAKESDLSKILLWAIPGVIGFFALAGIVAFTMSKQRD